MSLDECNSSGVVIDPGWHLALTPPAYATCKEPSPSLITGSTQTLSDFKTDF